MSFSTLLKIPPTTLKRHQKHFASPDEASVFSFVGNVDTILWNFHKKIFLSHPPPPEFVFNKGPSLALIGVDYLNRIRMDTTSLRVLKGSPDSALMTLTLRKVESVK